MTTDLETNIVAVERTKEYAEVATEVLRNSSQTVALFIYLAFRACLCSEYEHMHLQCSLHSCTLWSEYE